MWLPDPRDPPENPGTRGTRLQDNIPALDGLRAVSILLVVLSHAGLGRIVPGGLGVTLFFGISGFIITRLLLAEWQAWGRIDLPAFYLRRVLRLYPALLADVAAAGLVLLALGRPPGLAELGTALFYGANYHILFAGYAEPAPGVPHPFVILWSLAVEEHFYLIFPALLLLGLRLRLLLPLLLAGCALSLGWRLVLQAACLGGGVGAGGPEPGLCGVAPAWRLYMATDTRLDAMLYGCALAWLCHPRPGREGPPAWLRHPALAGLAAAALLASLAWRDPAFRETGRHAVQSLAIALGLGALLFSPALGLARRLLAWPPLLLLGRASYVVYLFHWLALVVACLILEVPLRDGPYPPLWYLLTLALTVGPVALVHGLIERPLVRLRRRLRPAGPLPPHPHPAAPRPGAGTARVE